MAKPKPEVPIPTKTTKRLWVRRFTWHVEDSLRSDKNLKPREAGVLAASKVRSEWSNQFPDVRPPEWLPV